MQRASKFLSFPLSVGMSRRTVAARPASGNAAVALGHSVAMEAGCGLCGCMFRSKGASGKIDEYAGEWPRGAADLQRHCGFRRLLPPRRAFALHRAISRRAFGAGAAAYLPARAGRAGTHAHGTGALVRHSGCDRRVSLLGLRCLPLSATVRTRFRTTLGWTA